MEKNIYVYKCKIVREDTLTYLGTAKQTEDIFEAAKEIGFLEYAEEVFGIFHLDAKGNITGFSEVSHGELSSTMVHPREVFKRALLTNSSAIIAVHNHPSGVTQPTEEDIEVTNRLVDAGKVLGIKVLDHIIVGPCNTYCSLWSMGFMNK